MKRILLIDDDKDISEMVQTILGGQYQVECKFDDKDIPAAITGFNPHLVLLDNSVARKSGADIMLEIKGTEQKTIPVVLFSAHADIAQIAAELNADGYLAKPFNLVDLYTCIDNLTA